MRNLLALICFLAVGVHAQTPRLLTDSLVDNNISFYQVAIAKRANLEPWFCILGSVDSLTKTYTAQALTLVWIDSAGSGSVYGRPSVGCTGERAIGTLHFHPGIGFCHFSQDDLLALKTQVYPLMALICVPYALASPTLVYIHKDEAEKKLQELQLARTKMASTTDSYPITYRYKPPP